MSGMGHSFFKDICVLAKSITLMCSPEKETFEGKYEQCALHCPHADIICFTKCSDEFDENTSRCPCQSKCPGGCPCPEYECERTEVLILSTQNAANMPVLTNSAGREDKNFNFVIDELTEVIYSCSLTWENEFYVFGGGSKKTQISKVTSCRLSRIGQLAFEHKYGDCVNVASKKVVLCFNVASSGDHKKCREASSPTGAFSEMTLSQYEHAETRIATNDGEFIKHSLIFTFYFRTY